MQLIYLMVGSLIASLTLFSLMVSSNCCLFALPNSSVPMSSILKANSSSDSADTPVVVVSAVNRSFIPAHSEGLFLKWHQEGTLEKAEKQLRQRRFKESIKTFGEALQDDSFDVRALLGLGKSYVETHQYRSAINALSLVRTECHLHRCRAEKKQKFADHRVHDLDRLPVQAREAIDYEARMLLEKAVLSSSKRVHLREAFAEYRNEHHCMVLSSCLALAKEYHARSQFYELAALFQLAKENTRNLPVGLITELMVDGPVAHQWSELSELALNAKVPEERSWYEEQIAAVAELLPEDDIRRAASYHFHGVCHLEDNAGAFENRQACNILESLKIPHDVFLANCHYDSGLIAYRKGDHSEALPHFQKALDTYAVLKLPVDMADTEFNIGCANYRLGNLSIAKSNFMAAARHYRSAPSNKESESLASYNAAAIAVDDEIDFHDEDFLREYNSRFKSEESATMLALFLFKSNRWEASLEPLTFAIDKCSANPHDVWPSLILAGNDAPKTIDRNFSNEQIVKEMFKRTNRIDEYVNTRWAPTQSIEQTCDKGDRKLTRDRSRDYSNLVVNLYPRALERSRHVWSVAEFHELMEKRIYKVTHHLPDSNSFSDEVKYLDLLRKTLQNYWYCPIHDVHDQTVVRLKIDVQGNVLIVSKAKVKPAPEGAFELKLTEKRITDSIMNETLVWATQMPPPPDSLIDRELIVLFDAPTSGTPGSINYGTPSSRPAFAYHAGARW